MGGTLSFYPARNRKSSTSLAASRQRPFTFETRAEHPKARDRRSSAFLRNPLASHSGIAAIAATLHDPARALSVTILLPISSIQASTPYDLSSLFSPTGSFHNQPLRRNRRLLFDGVDIGDAYLEVEQEKPTLLKVDKKYYELGYTSTARSKGRTDCMVQQVAEDCSTEVTRWFAGRSRRQASSPCRTRMT